MKTLPDTLYRGLPAAEITAPDADAGRIEAIVSVFDVVDSYGTRIKPGAFTRSLERRLPVGCWGHDWTQPVAKTTEARELKPGDPKLPENIRAFGGLYIAAEFNLETQRGRDAYSDVKNGLMSEFSIGFSVDSGVWTRDADAEIYDITGVNLMEWSPVVAGSNPATELISVRDAAPAATLEQHAETVLTTARALCDRIRDVADLRATDGRDLNPVNIERLTDNATALEALAAEMRAMVPPPTPTPEPDTGRAMRLAHLRERELLLTMPGAR